jgi:hypothetical protein
MNTPKDKHHPSVVFPSVEGGLMNKSFVYRRGVATNLHETFAAIRAAQRPTAVVVKLPVR